MAGSGLAAVIYVGVPMLRDERASAEAARREAAQSQTRALDAEQARRALEGRLRTLEEESRVLTEERNALRELATTGPSMTAELEALQNAVESKLTLELKKRDAQLRAMPGGRLRIDLASALLFANGESALSLSGQQVLMRLSSAFEILSPAQVHVYARPDAKESSGSTWGLAANRAVSVVRFISEKSTLPASRLVASGYGPRTEPQDAGELARRLEIWVTPGKSTTQVVEAPASAKQAKPKKRR